MPLRRLLPSTLIGLSTTIAAAQDRLPRALDTATLVERRQHWAWQPLDPFEPPTVDAAHAIDWFVARKLVAAGLRRSPPAPPAVQLRRVWFDLVGLPPPPERLARFLAAPSDAAYEREVDSLLASTGYGERQARHWLDLVRYSETLGHEFDFELPNAWRYRDYVIRACRDDLPYDQFLREHLAGDLLPTPRRGANGEDESVQATAAFWFGEQAHAPIDAARHQADRIDNQIDVFGKAMLGLTLACARCHDHKFDAIPSRDYYGLFGVIASSRYVQAPLAPCEHTSAAWSKAVAAQRSFADAWACAAALHEPMWRTFANRSPAEWAPASGVTLRPEDRIIASAEPGHATFRFTNDAFGPAAWRGPFVPDAAADEPELRLLPGPFWLSCAAGAAREGVAQTETFDVAERFVHVRAAGSHSRIVVVVDGLYLVRRPIYGDLRRSLDRRDAHWLTFDLGAWLGHTAFVQCLDQRAHDLADPEHELDEYPADAWLAVQTVALSPHATPPPTDTTESLPAATWHDLRAALEPSRQRLAGACAALPVGATVPALADGTGRDAAVFVRGDHRTPGELAPRCFLTALGGAALADPRGSGRLALAEALLDRGNPLPARVAVNRIWHHLFGRGLVRSVDNLGALGDRPSHPQLLDWLARDFLRHGWSTKHAIRRIVLSATYRQTSTRCSAGDETDPENLLLHRQHVRRLEAEAVRDSLLAASGCLDATPFGPPIPLPLDGQPEARGRPATSGPLDGAGRRSIYLAVRRNFLSPMLQAFDLPRPFATVGARSASNVPAQGLTLANDPFVHAMSERVGHRVVQAADDVAARVELLHALLLARRPDAIERQFVAAFVDAWPGPETEAWAAAAHAVITTTEFCHLR